MSTATLERTGLADAGLSATGLSGEGEPERIWDEGDADIPAEFHELLVRMLSYHVENSANHHYTDLLTKLWDRCLRFAPDEATKGLLVKLMQQEVEHGIINAQILSGLGVDHVDRPIEQYAFRHPMETFCDLSYFHALIDRVGVYIGETWDGVPYKPLLDIATRVHKEELFHCTLGLRNLRLICKTPEGLAEANEKIHFWWPAALDMFGRSDSDFGDAYVRWGLRKKNNADLRRQYIADTRPLLVDLGIKVPPNRLNRRFL